MKLTDANFVSSDLDFAWGIESRFLVLVPTYCN